MHSGILLNHKEEGSPVFGQKMSGTRGHPIYFKSFRQKDQSVTCFISYTETK